MARWAALLAGLIVWAVHFLGVYAIASVAEVAGGSDSPVVRWTVTGFSLACLAATAAIALGALKAARRTADEFDRFAAVASAGGAALAAVAILWQALPAWIGS